MIACLHGAVLGAGLELVAACDIRFCTSDASFKLAEVDIGLASDVGGLQRLPKIIGNQTLGSLMPWDCGLKLKPDLYVGRSLLPDLYALRGPVWSCAPVSVFTRSYIEYYRMEEHFQHFQKHPRKHVNPYRIRFETKTSMFVWSNSPSPSKAWPFLESLTI